MLNNILNPVFLRSKKQLVQKMLCTWGSRVRASRTIV